MKRIAGRGSLSEAPRRRTLLIASAVIVWLGAQIALVAWWATVIGRQARRIAVLEGGGGDSHVAALHFARTRLMLVGESSTFLALDFALSLVLAWLYWREQRRARSMQAFFAAVTHELRTPLTSIRLQAEAIAEGEQRAALARRLLEDSHRLESQIDKTLELARIEGGGPLSEQAIPLQHWLARALEDIGAEHPDGLQLQAQIDPGLPPILADSVALQMILRNLIDNSVRHGRVNPVQVQLRASRSGRRVLLTYRDNGVGVERVRRLGRLFGRGAGSSGAGVGLYLVRRLMQRMGGRVRFTAAPGAGFGAELAFRVGD